MGANTLSRQIHTNVAAFPRTPEAFQRQMSPFGLAALAAFLSASTQRTGIIRVNGDWIVKVLS